MSEWLEKEITYGAATIKVFRPNLKKEERERIERTTRDAVIVAIAEARQRNT